MAHTTLTRRRLRAADDDPGEVVTLTIDSDSEYEVGTADEASLMVVDDETPLVSVVKIADAFEGGANGLLRFTRTGDTSSTLSISYTITGTATPGTDYTALTGSATFAADEDFVDVPVALLSDSSAEDTETVIVRVNSGVDYGAHPDAIDVVYVFDDDTEEGIIGGVVWFDEDEDGIRDSLEEVAAGYTVTLRDEWGYRIAETLTDSYGAYQFRGLAEGTYYVQFYAPPLCWFTTPDVGLSESEDSDASQDNGWSDAIILVTNAMTPPSLDAGFVLTNAPDKPDLKVIFTDKAGKEIGTTMEENVVTNPLRVAKWHDAFDPTPGDPFKLRLRVGPIMGLGEGFDFIDRDNDRFNVMVKDENTWLHETNGMPTNPTITVKLSTSEVAGFEAYKDTDTVISLMRIPAGRGWDGWYTSDSQILVSNAADDVYSDPKYLGKDDVDVTANTPSYSKGKIGNEPLYTFQISDRTHRIALGSTLKATYGTEEKTEQLKIEKVVTVNAYILGDAEGDPLIGEFYLDTNANGIRDQFEKYRDDDGNDAYTPRLTEAGALARFTHDLAVANENYAQVGVRLVAGVSKVITATEAIANGEARVSSVKPRKEADLTATEKALVLGKFNSANKDDIEVYYVVNVILDTGQPAYAGWAFTEDYYMNMTTADVNDSILIADGSKYYVFGHELFHIFSQSAEHALRENLVALNSDNKVLREADAQIYDEKRLTVKQQKDIHDSAYAKNPT